MKPLRPLFWLTHTLAALLVSSLPSAAQQPLIAGTSLNQDRSRFTISFTVHPSSYYVLYRTDLRGEHSPRGIGTWASPVGNISDAIDGNSAGFYRIAAFTKASPADLDKDGIDDLYELRNQSFLNPFDRSDALLDQDGNGKSNLEDYRSGPPGGSTGTPTFQFEGRFSIMNSHVLAIRADGTLWAWGSNNFGQLGDGSKVGKTFPMQVGTNNNWVFCAASFQSSYAIDSIGNLWAWGAEFETKPKLLIDALKISAVFPYPARTEPHLIIIAKDKSLWSYDASADPSEELTRLSSDPHWISAASGLDLKAFRKVVVAVKSDGSLWQISIDVQGRATQPSRLGSRSNFRSVASNSGGGFFAIDGDDRIVAWGANSGGAFGTTSTSSRAFSDGAFLDTRARQASTSEHFTAAISPEGKIQKWGTLFYHAPPDTQTLKPHPFGQAGPWSHVQVGEDFVLAATRDGTLWFASASRYFPDRRTRSPFDDQTAQLVPVGFDQDWKQIVSITRDGISMGLKGNGTLWAWGQNGYGNPGAPDAHTATADPSSADFPRLLDATRRWTEIGVGANTFLSKDADGNVFAWNNPLGLLDAEAGSTCWSGQWRLSRQTLTPTPLSSLVSMPEGSGRSSSSRTHTLTILASGTETGSVRAWGDNSQGQLGNGTLVSATEESPTLTQSTFTKVYAGDGYSLGQWSTGCIFGWGALHKVLGLEAWPPAIGNAEPFFSHPSQIGPHFWAATTISPPRDNTNCLVILPSGNALTGCNIPDGLLSDSTTDDGRGNLVPIVAEPTQVPFRLYVVEETIVLDANRVVPTSK